MAINKDGNIILDPGEKVYTVTRHYNGKEVKCVCPQPMSESKIRESVKNLVEQNGEIWDSKLYRW